METNNEIIRPKSVTVKDVNVKNDANIWGNHRMMAISLFWLQNLEILFSKTTRS